MQIGRCFFQDLLARHGFLPSRARALLLRLCGMEEIVRFARRCDGQTDALRRQANAIDA